MQEIIVSTDRSQTDAVPHTTTGGQSWVYDFTLAGGGSRRKTGGGEFTSKDEVKIENLTKSYNWKNTR